VDCLATALASLEQTTLVTSDGDFRKAWAAFSNPMDYPQEPGEMNLLQ
jgi:hypothetical protein